MSPLWPVLLPELRRFPEAERANALGAARQTALDVVELLGMAAGLVAVTALTRYALPAPSIAERILFLILNAAVAVPLLLVALGPFHLRRMRRGLRKQLVDRRVR